MRQSSVTNRSSDSKLTLEAPWTRTTEYIASFYKVDEDKGLSEERVRQDLEKYGPNGRCIGQALRC